MGWLEQTLNAHGVTKMRITPYVLQVMAFYWALVLLQLFPGTILLRLTGKCHKRSEELVPTETCSISQLACTQRRELERKAAVAPRKESPPKLIN